MFPQNVAQEERPISSGVDFFQPSRVVLDSGKASEFLICEAFCGELALPPDAQLAGIEAFSTVLETAVHSVPGFGEQVFGEAGLRQGLPKNGSAVLVQLAMPTYYDLNYDKVTGFQQFRNGAPDDAWGVSEALKFANPDFGLMLMYQNLAAIQTTIAVFDVHVVVHFRSTMSTHSPPLTSPSCPALEPKEPPLAARSISCPSTSFAQCSYDEKELYGIALTNCDNQPPPQETTITTTPPSSECPFRLNVTREVVACGPPQYQPYNIPPFMQFSCSQTVVLDDTNAPVIICPPNVTLICGVIEGDLYDEQPNVTDGCGTIVIDATPLDPSCGITFVRTFTATDLCGNVATCSQEIIVNDIVATITCPPDYAGYGNCGETPEVSLSFSFHFFLKFFLLL